MKIIIMYLKTSSFSLVYSSTATAFRATCIFDILSFKSKPFVKINESKWDKSHDGLPYYYYSQQNNSKS